MGTRSRRDPSKGFQPNGLLPNETTSLVRSIDPERLAKAEDRTAELISHIQPNWSSEKHRDAVAKYVKHLITKCVPCQVFTFGSVPLKTYLPDGDIDLTVFSEDQNLKDNWANEVRDMLEREEKNEHAEFQVKEVQYIKAEVKIIKCLVDNIVVDISFNQLGGLCTLCFLEEVDNLISQNHLFKRSIILIKAWCYYESRILGAHHGLISTYALETLVLYTFHVFNNSFLGPLEVLYRFLEFFSKFDWGNFCVSLWGPVPISSLPSMAADPPRKDVGELLLNKMFLSACSTAYSVFPGGQETQEQPFITKHFNVIDPLRVNNNLGRSVNKGNFYRIRSAFSFGAQQLARILECQEENVVAAVNQFFVNTWDRHGKCSRVPADKQKDYNCSTSDVASGWDERYIQGHDLTKKQQNDTEENRRKQNRGRSKHQFARTYSSPELTNLSSEGLSQYMGNVAQEKVEKDMTLRSNYTRKTRGSCTLEKHVMNHATDGTSIRQSSKVPGTTFIPNHSFGIYVGNSAGSMPVCSSGDDSSQTRGEEKDVMNLISPSGIQNYAGHVQLPVNLSSHQLVQIPPSVLGYSHQIFTGTVPAYSADSDWGTVMHYSGGPPFPQQFSTVRVKSDQADAMGRLNDRAVLAEVDHQDDDCDFWTDSNAGFSKEIDPPNEDFSTVSSRLSPASPATSSRTKASSESSWDGKPSTMTTAVKKYHLGLKTQGSKNSIASVKNGWRDDGECVDHNYSDVDDDRKDWVSSESVASSVTNAHAEVQPLPGLSPVHMNYSSPVLSFAPMIVRPGPQQGGTNNHGVVAFYPAGPPVPFVTMVPVYNAPAQSGTSSAHPRQHDLDTSKPSFPVPRSGYGSDSANHPEKLNNTDSHHSMERTTSGEHPGEGGSDIFNSDFTSHWKNLQYGRFCQISQLQNHVVYSPSVVVPPQHLQGDLPFNGPKKPSPRSANVFAHAVPVSAQVSSSKPAGVSRRYGGDVSRNRNGTGTYFPNPKILKDHQFSNPRQYRGDYNYDRNEQHGNREANWNFSKPRFNGRAQARYYDEKPNTKMDQSAAHAFQADRQWDTFQHTSSHSHGSSNEHFVGTNGHVRNSYWRRGDHQLESYNVDSGPPSPDYASPPRYPSGDGI